LDQTRRSYQAPVAWRDILIDRSKEEDWSKRNVCRNPKRGVDVIVDNVNNLPIEFARLRKGGRLLTVGNSGAPRFEIDNRYIFAKHLSIIGSTMRHG
jgi:NADPH:quinone reductase-like Zn-dependent oxidoreductase